MKSGMCNFNLTLYWFHSLAVAHSHCSGIAKLWKEHTHFPVLAKCLDWYWVPGLLTCLLLVQKLSGLFCSLWPGLSHVTIPGGSISSVQFSCSVVSDSLRPHELQHARAPCPSPTPGVHSNSCSSSQWCHPAVSSSVVPFSSCPQSLPASVFSNESTLRMRWPKYWSFSFSLSPSNQFHSNHMNWKRKIMSSLIPKKGRLGSWKYWYSLYCKKSHSDSFCMPCDPTGT